MRFRHDVNALNDWATGDAGMPERKRKVYAFHQCSIITGALLRQQPGAGMPEHHTLVSAGFGGTRYKR